MNASVARSSSNRIVACGSRPPDSSRRRSIATAMPPMLPICRSSTTRSGSCSANVAAHVLAAGDLDDLLAGPDERRPHLVAHPLGVGGDEDRGHRVRRAYGRT